jgi:hypothetical protein
VEHVLLLVVVVVVELRLLLLQGLQAQMELGVLVVVAQEEIIQMEQMAQTILVVAVEEQEHQAVAELQEMVVQES